MSLVFKSNCRPPGFAQNLVFTNYYLERSLVGSRETYTSSISWIFLPNKTNGFKKCYGNEQADSTRIMDTNMFLYVLMVIRDI